MKDISEAGELSVDTDTIVSIVASAPVSVAVLYGSQARGEATEHSDVDLAVMFDDGLSSVEQTQARLSLIERLSVNLGTDAVDLTPLSRTPHALRREIYRDGIVLCGSEESLPTVDGHAQDQPTHADRMAQFDELLTDIERVV